MPQDRQVYSELDRSSWTYMPTLVRWRHRYRGVRESQKVNQEINQILYDLHEIRQIIEAVLVSIETTSDEEYLGKDDYIDTNYYDSIEEKLDALYHFGIGDMIGRLHNLDIIMREMENDV